jgi:hypothetical protein
MHVLVGDGRQKVASGADGGARGGLVVRIQRLRHAAVEERRERKPRAMGQEMVQRDSPGVQRVRRAEAGQVPDHWVVHRQSALFHQLEDGDGGKRFGERREPTDGVRCGRQSRFTVPPAKAPPVV